MPPVTIHFTLFTKYWTQPVTPFDIVAAVDEVLEDLGDPNHGLVTVTAEEDPDRPGEEWKRNVSVAKVKSTTDPVYHDLVAAKRGEGVEVIY